jgi:hypothetical protein
MVLVKFVPTPSDWFDDGLTPHISFGEGHLPSAICHLLGNEWLVLVYVTYVFCTIPISAAMLSLSPTQNMWKLLCFARI